MTTTTKTHAGVGYTLMSTDMYEVVSEAGTRLQPEPGTLGVYRSYATEEQAQDEAKAYASRTRRKYVGFVD